jgi:outer membrane protein TolC
MHPPRILRTIILCGFGYAYAQQAAKVLTLDDCIHLAMSVPSDATIARRESRIAALGVTQARSNFLPHFQIDTGYTYNSPPNSSSESAQSFVALNGIREYSMLGATALEIDTSGRLRAAYARAQADRQIAGSRLDIIRRDLRRLVTTSYYRLLLARRLIQANEAMLAEASAFEARTRQLFQGGEVAEADVIKAGAQTAVLRQSLMAAELDAEAANQELAAFWTSNVTERVQIEDTLERQPPPQPDSSVTQPYLKRFEFSLLEAEKKGWAADRRGAFAERLPRLNLVMQYGLDANRLTWNDRGKAVFGSLTIPVFDWFRARSQAEQFRLRMEQVDEQRAIYTREMSRDYQIALARTRSLHAQIAVAQTQRTASEDNLRLARVRYEGGEGPALDVVVAQTQLAQASTNYYLTLVNYANAQADLEVAAGR